MGFKRGFRYASAFLILLSLFSVIKLRSSQAVEVKAGASIIRVPSDFPTIQDAINSAMNGSTIVVDSGFYDEALTINRTLTLLGADKQTTVIEASGGINFAPLYTVYIINADNVVFDGFTVKGGYPGIELQDANSCVVSGNVVTQNPTGGIQLVNSNNNTISGNIVSQNFINQPGMSFGYGIVLENSSNNTVSGNFVSSNLNELFLATGADNNTVSGNFVSSNLNELDLETGADNNMIFQNDFMGTLGVIFFSDGNNWSLDGRGNYWSDYTGLDDGSNGRVAGDGVGDTNLPWKGVDYYPLITPTNPFGLLWDNGIFPASLVSNSTVSAFNFDGADKEFTFNLTGAANTAGYFNLSAPANLLSGPWRVLLDKVDVTSEAVISENQTYTNIYLNYSHVAVHSVQVIGTHILPEYSTATALFLLTLAALPLLFFAATKRIKRQTQTKSE